MSGRVARSGGVASSSRVAMSGRVASSRNWTPADIDPAYLVAWASPHRAGLSNGAAITTLADSGTSGTNFTGTSTTYDTAALVYDATTPANNLLGGALNGVGCAKLGSNASKLANAALGVTGNHDHEIIVLARADAVTEGGFGSFASFGSGSTLGQSDGVQTFAWWAGQLGVADSQAVPPAKSYQPDRRTHVFRKRVRAGKTSVSVDGRVILDSDTPTQTYNLSLGLLIGLWFASFGQKCRVWDCFWFARALDDGEVGRINKYLVDTYGLFVFCLDGDSLALGYPLGPQAPATALTVPQSPGDYLGAQLAEACSIWQLGQTGQTSTQILARIDTDVTQAAPGCRALAAALAADSLAAVPLLVGLSVGVNNIALAVSDGVAGAATDTALADIAAICDLLHARPSVRVLLQTPPTDPNGFFAGQGVTWYAREQARLRDGIVAMLGTRADRVVRVDQMTLNQVNVTDSFHPKNSDDGYGVVARGYVAAARGLRGL